MGTIRENIVLKGTEKKKMIYALFDSGASGNYIRNVFRDGDKAENIGFHFYAGRFEIILADGSESHGERVVFKEIEIGGHVLKEVEFVLLNNMTEDAIVGAPLMQKFNITLDLPNEKIII